MKREFADQKINSELKFERKKFYIEGIRIAFAWDVK